MGGYRRVNVWQNHETAIDNRRKAQATGLVMAERNQVGTAIRADPERAIARHNEQAVPEWAAQSRVDVVVKHYGPPSLDEIRGARNPQSQPRKPNTVMR